MGCLSPQAIYAAEEPQIERLGDLLAEALESLWVSQDKPDRSLLANARIREARDLAHAAGDRVWIPPGESHFGWTIIHDPEPTFKLSPMHGVIYLRSANPSNCPKPSTLFEARSPPWAWWVGSSRDAEEMFLSLGVTRFCPVSKMQFPPFTWHHDGRPTLAEMVTFVDRNILEK